MHLSCLFRGPHRKHVVVTTNQSILPQCLPGYSAFRTGENWKIDARASSRCFHNLPVGGSACFICLLLLLVREIEKSTSPFQFLSLSPISPSQPLCFCDEKQIEAKLPPAAAAAELMAAEESGTGNASFLERLIGGSRNRDISLFFPIVLGVIGPPRRDDAQQSSDDRGQERVVLINPFTQGMIVIDGGGASLEAFLRGLSEMESEKSGPPPASKASIEAMPAVRVAEEGAECAICLEGMEVGEEAKEMPCKHRYHGECIGKWLGLHGSCPVCRYRMPLEEGEVKKGEGERGAEGTRDGEIWVSFSLGTRDPTSSTPPAEQHDTLPNNLEG